MMFPVSVKSRLVSLELEEKTWYIDPETKVKHVRDAEYWGMPVGTPITPGMKPQKLKPVDALPTTTPKKPKTPKSSAARRASSTDDSLVAHSNTRHQPKSRVHPPFVQPEGLDEYRTNQIRKTYETRTRIPPRNIDRYEGLTSAEMHEDWAEESKRYRLPKWTSSDNSEPDKRTPTEKKIGAAVVSYTGDNYSYMNGLLRGDDVAVADLSSDEVLDLEKEIKYMDKAMRPVGRPLLVHRTTSAPVFQNLEPGDQFRDNGYVSTTIFEGYLSEVEEELYYGESDVQLSILVPPEAEGAFVTAFQDRKGEFDIGEGEVVLARGTEFRVVSREGNNLVIEVAPPGTNGSTDYTDNLRLLAQSKYEQMLAEEEGEDW